MRPRVTVRELAELARAQVALLRALRRVRTTPVGDLVAPPGQRSAGTASSDRAGAPTGDPALTRAERRAVAQRMELALARAGRRGLFRPTCLVHSLALVDLLGRNGATGAVIRLGVRPGTRSDVGRGLEAHAWVELDGLMLDGGTAQARRFTPLGAVQAAPPPRR